MAEKYRPAIFFNPESKVLMCAGKKVYLSDKTATLLKMLILSEGETISKSEILEECWGKRGIVVSNASIRQMVTQLRKKISELNQSPDIIITIPKYGYALESGSIFITRKNKPNFFSRETISVLLKSHGSTTINKVKKHTLVGTFFMSITVLFLTYDSEEHTRIEYFPIHHKSGVTYYSQNSSTYSLHIFDHIDKIVEIPHTGLLNAKHVYINNSSPGRVSAYYCKEKILNDNTECYSLLIFSHIINEEA